jgi:hypothetical protein
MSGSAAGLADISFVLDEVWLTDITEHPTLEGKLYVCAIIQKNVLDPAPLKNPWRTALRDHHRDRARLQPTPTPTRPRQVHPGRLRARLRQRGGTWQHDHSQPPSTKL